MTVTKTCRVHGGAFEANKPDTDICHSCWYAEEMLDARKRFQPFGDAIMARTGLQWEVWQTGGMCMCLVIILKRNKDGEVVRYLMAGDFEFETAWGFGIFDDEHFAPDDQDCEPAQLESMLTTGDENTPATTPEVLAEWLYGILWRLRGLRIDTPA